MPLREQPLRVGVGRQRRAGLARQVADHGGGEDQVGAEHAQVPVLGVLVVDGDLGHQRVEGDGAGVVGHDEGPTRGGDVLDAPGLHPEPVAVQRAQQVHHHGVGQLGVETELVDVVLAGQPPAQERHRGGKLRLDLAGGRVGRQVVGDPPSDLAGLSAGSGQDVAS